ncbi:hypothetical protein DFP85_106108 [Halomonas ventosae]|uniref:Uncharacterized protein n=1 Tax=Halomonas ventosae TaxID=229007 RepID=A0A4R6ZQQ2_9GAMM|nr:hypothetical protein DFP85_106108 [Halomonas ventosae]
MIAGFYLNLLMINQYPSLRHTICFIRVGCVYIDIYFGR